MDWNASFRSELRRAIFLLFVLLTSVVVNLVLLPIETHGLGDSNPQDVWTNMTIDYLAPRAIEGKLPTVSNDIGMLNNSNSNSSQPVIQIKAAKVFSYDLTSASVICEMVETNSILNSNKTLESSTISYLSSITSISSLYSGNNRPYLSKSQNQSILGQEVTMLGDSNNQVMVGLWEKERFFFTCMAAGANIESRLMAAIESIVSKYPNHTIPTQSNSRTQPSTATQHQANNLGWLTPLMEPIIIMIVAMVAMLIFFYFSKLRKAKAVSWNQLSKKYG